MYALETIHALERVREIEYQARETAKLARAALHDVRALQASLNFDTSETDALIQRLRTEPITWREIVTAYEKSADQNCVNKCVHGWTTVADESYSSLDRPGGSLVLVRCELH